MEYTHILMPMKCRVIQVREYIKGVNPELDASPTGSLLQAFQKNNCMSASVIWVNNTHEALYLNTSHPFTLKELPSYAKELSLALDGCKQKHGSANESNARTMGFLAETMGVELVERPPAIEDDEIPF